jgi:hypothetical protein
MEDNDQTKIPTFTADELRARNQGINPDMPAHPSDANGTRWQHTGPIHDTSR